MKFLSVVILLLLEVGSGLEDSYEQVIVSPCPKLDPSCVRNFFAQHSQCQPAYGLFQDIYDIDELTLPLPHANCTLIWRNARVTGLGAGDIVEFLVDRNTRQVVFEVEFGEVTTYCPAATLRYHRKGMEAFDLTDYLGIKYRKVSLTAVVPFDCTNGIRLLENQVYGYFGDTRFPIIMGNGLTNSDHDTSAVFAKWASDMPLGVKESFVVVGPYYFSLYFNNNMCKI